MITPIQPVRLDFIHKAQCAIVDVRDIITKLNEAEKEYLQRNSPVYRQLVDMLGGNALL